ncbi:ISKra4 family transposase [Streptomyces sp. RG80]|uniref:ISKra4 family transposase n=1 Tax=Streptomyces sp. RG80 TaxID=3157340 RepID=UPI00338FABEC
MTGAYAASAVADPFDRATSFLTCLIDSLSRPDALLLPHDQVEQDAENGARELARLLLQGHLDLRARREEAHLTALEAGGRAALAAGRTRLEKHHRRQLATVVGTVTVTRCALRAPNRPNYYPADVVLGLPGVRHSLGPRRLAVLEAARGSYDQAVEAVERHCGTPPLGKRQAEQLVRAAAVDIAAFYAARTPAPAAHTTLLVLSVDGKGIVMLPGHLREATRKAAERATRTFRTRLSAGEKTGRKRMATLAVVHDADPAPRRPHDNIAPPGGRATGRIPRKGPKARAKSLTASVGHHADQVIAAAFDEAQARDPQHRRCWVVLVDGAAHQLELIQKEADRRAVTIHIVLDIVHVIEKVSAWTGAGKTAGQPWFFRLADGLTGATSVTAGGPIATPALPRLTPEPCWRCTASRTARWRRGPRKPVPAAPDSEQAGPERPSVPANGLHQGQSTPCRSPKPPHSPRASPTRTGSSSSGGCPAPWTNCAGRCTVWSSCR